jgi:preprotein translocase subunit YajC
VSNVPLLVLYVLGFILIFYFMAIRPQQRQRRAHEEMTRAVKKGDQVVTVGGIVGTIKRTDDEFVMLEVSKGVQIKLARRAIAEITSADQIRGRAPAVNDDPEALPPAGEGDEWGFKDESSR